MKYSLTLWSSTKFESSSRKCGERERRRERERERERRRERGRETERERERERETKRWSFIFIRDVLPFGAD